MTVEATAARHVFVELERCQCRRALHVEVSHGTLNRSVSFLLNAVFALGRHQGHRLVGLVDQLEGGPVFNGETIHVADILLVTRDVLNSALLKLLVLTGLNGFNLLGDIKFAVIRAIHSIHNLSRFQRLA